MNQEKTLYIFNPKAKKGKAKKFQKKVMQYLKELEIMGNFIELKKLKDVKNLAEKAEKDGIKKIVAIGGDGIVNEIIQEIAEKEISLGIIPLGEANILANILGIDSWQLGCESIAKSNKIDIDLGKANDKYFTSTLEIREKTKNQSFLSRFFLRKNERKYFPISMAINKDTDNLKLSTNISSLIISTIPIPIPKDLEREKELRNEELNIFIKSKPIAEAKNKKTSQDDEVSILKAKDVKLTSKSTLPVIIDGEEKEKTPLKITIAPKSLTVIIPEKNN